MGDSYRPGYPYPNGWGHQYGYGHQPASAPYPPLPPEPPPEPPQGYPHPMYAFGQYAQANHPQSFAFEPSPAYPQYPTNTSLPLPPPQSDRYDPRPRYSRNDQARGPERRDRPRPRAFRPRVATAERPLLTFKRGNTPDQMPGMEADEAAQRYRDIQDVSDSEEENMVESDIEGKDGEADPNGAQVEKLEQQPAAKWSNAELYTALPPTQELTRKKKDVVKMIRKARVAAKGADSLKQLARNDDYISFDFDDEERDKLPEATISTEQSGPPLNAPTGPRASLQQVSQNTREQASSEPTSADLGASIAERLSENRKRKRSLDDDGQDEAAGLEVPTPKRRQHVKQRANGQILPEWQSVQAESPIPWASAGKHSFTEAAGFRLHKEICDFFDFVRPQNFEEAMRQDLLQRTRKAISRYNSECEVHCFGSFAAGLYLPDADMDVVVLSRKFQNTFIPMVGQSTSALYKIADWLVRQGLAHPQSIEVVAKAKVPLVKFIDKLTGIRIDMSFENVTGLQANTTFGTWKAQYPAMPILVTVVKQFLLMRGLNEVVNGGIGGFTVTCLVTSLLQNMPRVQTQEFKPENNLGEVLLEFLDYYGNQFDLSRTAIKLQPPSLVHKVTLDPRKWMTKIDRLHLVDPNNADNDISGGSRNILLVFEKFALARAEILAAMRSKTAESYLHCMLAGNYSRYLVARERLRRLNRKYGILSDEHEQGAVPITPKATTVDSKPSFSLDEKDIPKSVLMPKKLKTGKPSQPDKPKSEKTKPEESTPGTSKPKKSKPATTELTPDAQRAVSFREKFPNVKDVPDTLTKEQYRKLAEKFKPGTCEPTPDAQRAVSFRENFPQVKDVPDTLTKEEYRILVEKSRQRITGPTTGPTPGAQRALSFRENFPKVTNVPDTLTKEQYRNLVEKFRQGTAPMQDPQEENEAALTRAREVIKRFPELNIPDRITEREVESFREQGFALQLRNQFPGFQPHVPTKLTHDQADVMKLIFTLAQQNRALHIPMNLKEMSTTQLRALHKRFIKKTQAFNSNQNAQEVQQRKKRKTNSIRQSSNAAGPKMAVDRPVLD